MLFKASDMDLWEEKKEVAQAQGKLLKRKEGSKELEIL